MFLPEVTDKIVFFSLIAINGMLKSHCDNLSTYHYHPIYHPCFYTQSSHEQTMQQYFRAVAIPSSKKASESDRAALFLQKVHNPSDTNFRKQRKYFLGLCVS